MKKIFTIKEKRSLIKELEGKDIPTVEKIVRDATSEKLGSHFYMVTHIEYGGKVKDVKVIGTGHNEGVKQIIKL